MTSANGTSTVYSYNKANLVTSVVNKKGATTLSSHAYTYYLDGNIHTETVDGETKTYVYDGLGRLTREEKTGTIGVGTITYTYDERGNRATKVQGTATTTYEYDANNRLIKETLAGVSTTYTYDANGNTLASMVAGTPTFAYSYNLFGKQVSYSTNGIIYTYYTYRPDGLRHSIGNTVHLWDGANIVADIEDSDITTYVRGINLIYAENDGDKTYHHYNAHGDVIALTNENGVKTRTYTYSAFGVEYSKDALDQNPFRYCGEYYDAVSDTIYLRARYYNAGQGRFTQEDVHWNIFNMIYGDVSVDNGYQYQPDIDAIIQSCNLYVYCVNNPVLYKDISGENKGFAFRYEYYLTGDWRARFDRGMVGNSDHIHVYNTKTKEEWVMNLDGSMSHENKSEKGDPPSKVLKKLKERTDFDYEKVRKNFKNNDEAALGGGMYNTFIYYTDGSIEINGICYYNLDSNDVFEETQKKDYQMSLAFQKNIFVSVFDWLIRSIVFPVEFPLPLPAT